MSVSFLLNSMIVFAFAKAKQLRTPINLIIVHLSVVSVLPVILVPFNIATFVEVMVNCDCTLLYYRWISWQLILFGIYPLNVLILSFAYLVILKFSGKFLTFKMVITSLVIIWSISILINIPTAFITTVNEFVDCCETVCMDGTALCNNITSLDNQTFTPRVLVEVGIQYYNWRDLFILLIPSLLIIIATLTSYFIFRLSFRRHKKIVQLELRMILLPVMLTLIGGPYFIGEDTINWIDTSISDERFPGIVIFAVSHMLWDTVGLMFAILILFFNVKIRFTIYQEFVQKLYNRFRNKATLTPQSSDIDPKTSMETITPV